MRMYSLNWSAETKEFDQGAILFADLVTQRLIGLNCLFSIPQKPLCLQLST